MWTRRRRVTGTGIASPVAGAAPDIVEFAALAAACSADGADTFLVLVADAPCSPYCRAFFLVLIFLVPITQRE